MALGSSGNPMYTCTINTVGNRAPPHACFVAPSVFEPECGLRQACGRYRARCQTGPPSQPGAVSAQIRIRLMRPGRAEGRYLLDRLYDSQSTVNRGNFERWGNFERRPICSYNSVYFIMVGHTGSGIFTCSIHNCENFHNQNWRISVKILEQKN